jgi:hypothetical protein
LYGNNYVIFPQNPCAISIRVHPIRHDLRQHGTQPAIGSRKP